MRVNNYKISKIDYENLNKSLQSAKNQLLAYLNIYKKEQAPARVCMRSADSAQAALIDAHYLANIGEPCVIILLSNYSTKSEKHDYVNGYAVKTLNKNSAKLFNNYIDKSLIIEQKDDIIIPVGAPIDAIIELLLKRLQTRIED